MTKTKEITTNFSKFSKDIISKHPQILLIVRLAAGMPQREFSRKIRITRSALVNYELGISKTMKRETAKRVTQRIEKIKNLLDFSEKNIIKNFNNLWYQAEHGQPPDKLRNYGRSALKTKKLNKNEKNIFEILEKMKIVNEREGILKFMGIPFFFDFVLPNTKKPRFIIECKKVESKSKRNFKIISYKIAYEIGYKFRLLKEKYPEIKTILILESEIEKIPERVVKIFENEIDYFFHNMNKKDIIKFFSKINHPRPG